MPTTSPQLPRPLAPRQAPFVRIVALTLLTLTLDSPTIHADGRVKNRPTASAATRRREAKTLRTRLKALSRSGTLTRHTPVAINRRTRKQHPQRINRDTFSVGAPAPRRRRPKPHKKKHLARDARLDRVAEANSLALAEVNGKIPVGALSFLRFELHRAGVHDAVLRATILRYRRGDTPQFPERLRRDLISGRYTHLGVGIAALGKRWVATVILVRRLVALSKTTTLRRRWLHVCGRPLHRGALTVLMTSPDGTVQRRRPRVRRHRFCTWLPALAAGRYQIEVMAPGPYGPEVAALFPIFVGIPKPQRPRQRLYPPPSNNANNANDARRGEPRLLDLINRSRSRAHLSPLHYDARLARVARHHSQDMASQGFFGHVSPHFGGLQQRMNLAGLGAIAASENLALATTTRRAHDALLDSPSHRAVLLDPHAIAVGIGIVREPRDGLYYITECFARRNGTP